MIRLFFRIFDSSLRSIHDTARSCFCSRAVVVSILLRCAVHAEGNAEAPAPSSETFVTSSLGAGWSLHVQSTLVDQWHGAYSAAYSGDNSFLNTQEDEHTLSLSLYLGHPLWRGADIFYNPEGFQGYGLSRTLGVAGFPNGEAVKSGYGSVHYNTSRLFLRQVFGLGGETEQQTDDVLQCARVVDVNRLIFSVGKFSAGDFFDGNAYSHDPRTQFLNWSLMDSGAWDYPADVVGFTGGAVLEWNTRTWMLHYGLFMEPRVSNGARLDPHLEQAHGQILQFDQRYLVGGHAGTLRPFVYWNQARMGNYDQAVHRATVQGGADITATAAYRSKLGFGLSWDQALAQDLGIFARLSHNDGRTESWAFTEIDSSAALGLSMKGQRWGRAQDTLGLACVENAISGSHQRYLAAGGSGLILGDGALSPAREQVLEVYYDLVPLSWARPTPS